MLQTHLPTRAEIKSLLTNKMVLQNEWITFLNILSGSLKIWWLKKRVRVILNIIRGFFTLIHLPNPRIESTPPGLPAVETRFITTEPSPEQGSNPGLLSECGVLATGSPGKSNVLLILYFFFFYVDKSF